jgi:cation transport ATPase
VREAEHQRAPVEALADHVAKYVVYFAFTFSSVTLYMTGMAVRLHLPLPRRRVVHYLVNVLNMLPNLVACHRL